MRPPNTDSSRSQLPTAVDKYITHNHGRYCITLLGRHKCSIERHEHAAATWNCSDPRALHIHTIILIVVYCLTCTAAADIHIKQSIQTA